MCLELYLTMVLNRRLSLHGLLRPGPQTSFKTFHFQELTDMLEHTVDLGRDRDSQAPVELLKVLDAGLEVSVQLLTEAGHDHLIKLDKCFDYLCIEMSQVPLCILGQLQHLF